MAFHPLPRRLALATSLVLLVITLAIAWGSFKHPETFWAPGNLSRYHADIDSCLTCHAPFQGAVPGRCVACHSRKRFERHSKPSVSASHQRHIQTGESCTGCHTEHLGPLAQITAAALDNPHGEFVFRATGTTSCGDCHDFVTGQEKPLLLDNTAVKSLLDEGDGAHRRGSMASCLHCHGGGLIDDIDENEDD